MAVNSSSSSLSNFYHCDDFTLGFSIAVAYNVTKILLLLPLSLLVLYLGLQEQARTSHSDIFTYHSVVIGLIYVLGTLFFYCGKYLDLSEVMKVGFYLCCIAVPGETSFHLLTCIERYLAVVHPIIYLGLRHSGGFRIRNITIGCVWLLCFGWIGVIALCSPNFPYFLFFSFLALALAIVSFCSFSVLRVLIRPGPGDRERVDQTKQRAFHTITTITGVLWLFFLGLLVCVALDNSNLLSYKHGCLALVSGNWFSLPSSLVLSLLFLHRAGKLLCCHCSHE